MHDRWAGFGLSNAPFAFYPVETAGAVEDFGWSGHNGLLVFPLEASVNGMVNQTPPRACDGTAVCRVTYRMTDQMGMVYYANYLELFEMGRIELMRSLGVSYPDMEAAGYLLAVTHCACDYLAPARFDDLLRVTARVPKLSRARLHFEYEIRRDGETTLLARGVTHHAFMSPEGRARRLDVAWFGRLQSLIENARSLKEA